MAAFESKRYFEVWDLSPSHRVLLLRSNPSWMDESTTRIEIQASHVDSLMIKPRMQGLRIGRADSAEHEAACLRFGIEANPGTLYLLETEGFSGFLVSGQPQWREATRQLGDPSLFTMRIPDLEIGGEQVEPMAFDITSANID